MKKYIMFLLNTLSIVLIYKPGYSQADIAGLANGHDRSNGYYCGWGPSGTSTAGSLEIRNNFTSPGYPINFYTNNNSTPYMTILGSTNPGYVGIGLTAPQNLLHIDAGSMQITNGTTANGSGDGLLIGQLSGASTTVEINNRENSPMKFHTNGTSRVFIANGGDNGYVGIGNTFLLLYQDYI